MRIRAIYKTTNSRGIPPRSFRGQTVKALEQRVNQSQTNKQLEKELEFVMLVNMNLEAENQKLRLKLQNTEGDTGWD